MTLPAEWALEEARKRVSYSEAYVLFVRRNPEYYPLFLLSASLIEKYEQPPVDPVLLRAREIVAQQYLDNNCHHAAQSIKEGEFDTEFEMKVAIKALREECPK